MLLGVSSAMSSAPLLTAPERDESQPGLSPQQSMRTADSLQRPRLGAFLQPPGVGIDIPSPDASSTSAPEQQHARTSPPVTDGAPASPAEPPIDWSVVDAFIELRRPRVQTGDPNTCVSSSDMLFMTFRNYQKGRDFRILPFYTLCVVMLCFIAFANRIDFLNERSNYWVQQSILQRMHGADFGKIETSAQFFDWLRAGYTRINEESQPGDRSTPLGFILVRSLRTQSIDCKSSAFEGFSFVGSPRCPAGQLTTNSFPPLLSNASSAIAGTAAPTGRPDLDVFFDVPLQWSANANNDARVDAQDIAGEWFGMEAPDKQFEVLLFLTVPNATRADILPRVLALIDDMEARGYVDEFTVSVSVETLFYHVDMKRFTRTSFLLEQLPSAVLLPSTRSSTIKGNKRGGTVADLTLTADVFMILFIVFQLVDLVQSILARHAFTRSWPRATATLQHLLSAAIALTLAYVMVLRMEVWADIDGLEYDEDPPSDAVQQAYWHRANAVTMFHKFSFASGRLELSFQWFGLTMVPIVMKMLLYFQDVRGFNIIHKTILIGLKDLLTVLVVAVVVLSFFALAGNVFFGGVSYSFLTFNISFATLARLVVSADPGVVTDLLRTHPRETALFFGLFFLSLWLVLLNFVLGIIVSGVTSAMAHNTSRAAASYDTLSTVFYRYMLMKGPEYKRARPSAVESANANAGCAATRHQLSFADRVRLWRASYHANYDAVLSMAEHAKMAPVVFRSEVDRLLRMLLHDERHKLFDACLYATSDVEQATALMEERGAESLRAAAELSADLHSLDRAIRERLSLADDGADTDSETSESDRELSADTSAGSWRNSFALSFTRRLGSERKKSSSTILRQQAASGGASSLRRTRQFNVGFKRNQFDI